MNTDASQRTVTGVLRDLAWTIHRRVPDMSDISDPLPTTELAVLKHLLDTPGITVTELSRRLGLQQSNTSAAVRTLVDRGFVTREPSPADRRVSNLLPTASARAEDEAIAEAWSGTIRAALAALEPKQVAAIEAAAEAMQALDQVMRAEQVSSSAPDRRGRPR